MPDSTPPPAITIPAIAEPATPAAQPPRPPGFFNKAQLADIKTGEDIYAAACDPAHATVLEAQEINAAFLTRYEARLQIARDRLVITGQNSVDKKTATRRAHGTEATLLTALQGIQSAAKQRQRTEATDDDPATNFRAEGYLIGDRLNPSRADLLQNAATLITKAKAEPLPGHKVPRIVEIERFLTAYEFSETDQTRTTEESSAERIARDKVIADINNFRIATQHAADRIYPATNEENRPARRTFELPPDRALGL